MDNCFSLKHSVENENSFYLDVPGSRCEEGVQVEGYPHLHGGDNQQWLYDGDQLVSMIAYPSYSLAVEEIKEGSPVVLHCKDDNNNGGRIFYSEWILENDHIKLKNDKDYCIGLTRDCFIILQLSSDKKAKWEKVYVDCKPKPASSCHLTYEPPSVSFNESWTLENSVCVRESASSTYFCVVGWGPGGYSGIQQDEDNKRFAIFSMWNNNENQVSVQQFGDGVEVSKFDGEGTGMKAMKSLDWNDNEKISFRVSGKRVRKESSIFWLCSCWYSIQDSDWFLMATYERPGIELPFNQHFYSFIENWDRCLKSDGHKANRCAEFSDAKMTGDDNEINKIGRAFFTKVQDGADGYAADKAFGGVKSGVGFMLSTGGDSAASVRESLEKLYEQCTNTYLTDLYL